MKLLLYDGQGYWLRMQRRSTGRFAWWPTSADARGPLSARELIVLLWNGLPDRAQMAQTGDGWLKAKPGLRQKPTAATPPGATTPHAGALAAPPGTLPHPHPPRCRRHQAGEHAGKGGALRGCVKQRVFALSEEQLQDPLGHIVLHWRPRHR